MHENGVNGGSEGAAKNGTEESGKVFAHASIPDHELLRIIGSGSYGEVWLARNTMGMHRAVKIVHRKSFRDQRPFDREVSGIQKFEPLSRSHEGFIDVLHAGLNEQEGYFFYVMELGDDQTSGQQINPDRYRSKTLATEISRNGGRLSLEECLQLGLALSHALAELHNHGLVHRDVKPSNIIFAHDVPKLADIGLVADINEARSFVGTEGFIPPEGPGTPQADVYSLGKVLYEALTGKDRQEFPELPTHLDNFPERDRFLEFNNIILRACNGDVTRRYQSAADLHGDLLLLANGKSVRRLWMLEQRLSQLKRIAVIAGVVLMVLSIVSYQIYRDRKIAIEARQQKVGANIANGNNALASGDLMGALPYYTEAFRLDKKDPDSDINHRLRLGALLAQSPKLTRVLFIGNWVNHCEFSPDGRKIAVAEYSGRTKVYDVETGELDGPAFGQRSGLMSASFDPEGKLVVTASRDNTACVWALTNRQLVLNLKHTNIVHNARWSPDGQRIVTACQDLVRVWNVRTSEIELKLDGHTGGVLFADFSHDGRLIVTCGYDKTARLWNADTGQPVTGPLVHQSWVTDASFSPDNKRLITASLDRKARVWDLATGKQMPPDLDHHDGVKSAKFSPDGQLILTACWDGTARLWRANDLRPLASNPVLKHHDRVLYASFCPEARRILTTCSDGTARIWDLAGIQVPPVPQRASISQDGDSAITWTNDVVQITSAQSESRSSGVRFTVPSHLEKVDVNGSFIFTSSVVETNRASHVLQLWNAKTGKPVTPPISITNVVNGIAVSSQGRHIAVFGERKITVWTVQNDAASARYLSHDDTVGCARFSSDERRLIAKCGNKLFAWDLNTGKLVFGPLKHPQFVQYAAFSADDSRIVTCCSDAQLNKGSAYVWNATTGDLVCKLNHRDGVLSASFSPDGKKIVTASEDFTAIVWDTTTGRPLFPPLAHEDKVHSAIFSPDGKRIASSSSDRTIRLWNAQTGEPLAPPLRHEVTLIRVQYLADWQRTAGYDRSGNVWIWDLALDRKPINDLIAIADLLSGQREPVLAPGTVSQPSSIQTTWEELRAKYPDTFSVSAQQIAAWHEFQAANCKVHQQWAGAEYHLKFLSADRLDKQSNQDLARSRQHLTSRP